MYQLQAKITETQYEETGYVTSTSEDISASHQQGLLNPKIPSTSPVLYSSQHFSPIPKLGLLHSPVAPREVS